MKRDEGLLVFSLGLTMVLFTIYKSPPLLYFGLLYSMMVAFSRKNFAGKELRIDKMSLTGLILILTSPMFLVVKLGQYPSPATFQALVLIGVSLILFEARSTMLPNSIATFEAFLAVAVRVGNVKEIIAKASDLFVSMTSYLVRGLIDLFNVPIVMMGNIAVVRNSVVVIGSGCSGLDAFILYLLAAALLALLRKSDRREAFLLILGALGIIPLNALRIFTLLVIGYHSGISFLELFHSHLGDLMFVVYVFGYWWLVLKSPKKHQDTSGETWGKN